MRAMNIRGNTMLVTGGSSGIGRALAEKFHELGNKVIIAGRQQESLRKVTEANPGMAQVELDLQNPEFILAAAHHVAEMYPMVNVLINNGGIQKPEKLLEQSTDLSVMTSEIEINLLGQIRLTAALLPLLRRQAQSTIINVTSGLAFVPMASVPTYCATKAALHSYTMSLRQQLRQTTTGVIEIVPPQVQTNLSPNHVHDERAMPLKDFIAEVMTILEDGSSEEVVVERCKPIRFATERGTFTEVFKTFNART